MILIPERLRPFSHRPKISCLIPQTTFEAEIFPARVRIYDLKSYERKLIADIPISIKGPLKDFTVFQDLEKGIVTVRADKLVYHLLPTLELLYAKKGPSQIMPKVPRLFLGMHKQQEWEEIRFRCDFREIFPLWLKLGKILPEIGEYKSSSGMFSLLEECQTTIKQHRPEYILQSFYKLFLAGFRGVLVPRLYDEEFQGIIPDFTIHQTPLHLLKEGANLITSLFVTYDKKKIFILPNLPPDFFSGRFIDIPIFPFGTLSLEWTKKCIHKMVFKSHFDGPLLFQFPSSVKRFRVREGKKERGKYISCGNDIEINSNKIYLLDRFEK